MTVVSEKLPDLASASLWCCLQTFPSFIRVQLIQIFCSSQVKNLFGFRSPHWPIAPALFKLTFFFLATSSYNSVGFNVTFPGRVEVHHNLMSLWKGIFNCCPQAKLFLVMTNCFQHQFPFISTDDSGTVVSVLSSRGRSQSNSSRFLCSLVPEIIRTEQDI